MRGNRRIRDPIHGDIGLSPVAAAVVDTVTFQRLRYIRQNGLLHFVFPGAVHTRFIHSIGTMWVAGRVFRRLVEPICGGEKEPPPSIVYLRSVFEIAALLHDVGHCAFSHAIEGVVVDNHALLGTVESLFKDWKEEELLVEYLKKREDGTAQADVQHEAIGLILIKRIFAEATVEEACTKTLESSGADVGRDVRSLVDDRLEYSDRFRACADELCALAQKAAERNELYAQIDEKRFAADLQHLLHTLVSGTLDVDRLDYLNRDSVFCGVPYGRCDIPVLVGGLDIGAVEGETQLLLHEKAASALDDMLWSRYQLFVQVLNHKTNVALNEMLGEAIQYAIGKVYLSRPKTCEEYLMFTDDYVMSKVLELCIRGDKEIADTPFVKTLARRQIPLHLGSTRLEKGEPAELEEAKAARLAAFDGKLKPGDLISVAIKSELVKKGPLPTLYRWSKAPKALEILDLSDRSSIFGKDFVPPIFRVLHCYVDRSKLSEEGQP